MADPAKRAVDETLRRFATDRQWECYVAYCETAGWKPAAKRVGIAWETLRDHVRALERKAAQHAYAPAHDQTHDLPDGQTVRGVSTLYGADGRPDKQWVKSRPEGREAEETTQLPDPKRITKTAKLFDQSGKVIQEWVSEKADEKEREALWRLFAEELAATLPRAEAVQGPEFVSEDLLAAFPVGDHHLGMLAWAQETGGDSYDLSIAEKLLVDATDYLMQATPVCGTALVAVLGDYLHYDSFEPVTPTNRNLLDADGRYPKMVRVAIRAIRYMIAAALRRHARVHVIVEIGNHDPSSAIFLTECLACLYENEPRVTVDTSPAHYHYFEFGRTLIGTHHGHGSKLEKLPGIMAADRPEAWGRTRHRYWWTGHIHNRQAQDFAGCSVESFRILAPVDAWAAQKGYRAVRDMRGLVIHREHGEVARHTVNPGMFTPSPDFVGPPAPTA
jgi:hypothetical protein